MEYIKWIDAQKILGNKKVTYLWFGADWCGDCQMMKPILEEVEKHFAKNKNIQFIKVNVQEARIFKEETEYKVYKIPTHVLMHKGEIKNILYEYVPKEVLIDEIEKLLNNND